MSNSPLSARRLWDIDWFDESAAEAVVKSTGLSPQKSFDLNRIAQALTRIANHSVSDQLYFRRSAKDWGAAAKATRAALDYHDLAQKWTIEGIAMRRLNPDQIKSLQAFEEFAVECGKRNQRRRKKAWVDTFYIDMLGLFSAVFEREPKSYVSDSDKRKAHETVFFVHKTLEHISKMQSDDLYISMGFSALNERIDWGLHDLGTIGSHIAIYKKVTFGTDDRPHWQERRDEFLLIT